ncbi:chaplin family protein [Nocardiopsis mangrovi]|uniref:Chaplin family protein n=1 Tax=Nocardiopsis mangrovi TaxID=1179818 RepID=A0ABV9E131_9ACTN
MLKNVLAAGAVAAAFAGALLAGTPAYAADDVSTSGNGSLLGGNQLVADLDIPINLCGNAIAVLGNAGASCDHSGAAVIEDIHVGGHGRH